MTFPTTAIAFGVVVLGRVVLGRLRINYLRDASKDVSIDPSQEIVLHYLIWSYVYPVLGFGGAVFLGWGALHETSSLRVITYSVSSVLFFFIGSWLLYRQSIARVRIAEGRLVYTEGSTRYEIGSDEVSRFSLNGFKFIIKRTSGRIIQIPASFKSGEIILAFLQHAANK